MEKKFTNQEIGQIIGKLAEEVRNDIIKDLQVAKTEAIMAENNLINALNDEQKKLFYVYVEKQNEVLSLKKSIGEKD